MKNAVLYIICLLTSTSSIIAQQLFTPSDIEVKGDYDNISVKQLYSDSLSTSYIIWVRKEVALHKHEFHTESVYILKGSAEMKIGEDNYSIVTGDYLIIPQNTPHSVVVTSQEPLKLISIQSPEFKGNDRVLVK